MQFNYHFKIDNKGYAATVDEESHILQMMEQILFTAPGERVNRPNFGTGLDRLVFASNSDELAAATQFLVQGALQQWLGSLIMVNSVQITNEDSTLMVSIQYTIKQNQQPRVATFTRTI